MIPPQANWSCTMINPQRRRFLKAILGALAGAAGSVVLATSETKAAGPAGEPQPAPPDDIQDRADRLADAVGAEEQEAPLCGFVNRAFRNSVGGGFRNGGFAHRGGGGGGRPRGGGPPGRGGGPPTAGPPPAGGGAPRG